MSIRSILTGRSIKPGDMEDSWQEFVISRQDVLEAKLDTAGVSPRYIEAEAKLYKLLESALGQDKFDEIYDALRDKEVIISYLHYNKGFLDGIKFALMAGQL